MNFIEAMKLLEENPPKSIFVTFSKNNNCHIFFFKGNAERFRPAYATLSNIKKILRNKNWGESTALFNFAEINSDWVAYDVKEMRKLIKANEVIQQ